MTADVEQPDGHAQRKRRRRRHLLQRLGGERSKATSAATTQRYGSAHQERCRADARAKRRTSRRGLLLDLRWVRGLIGMLIFAVLVVLAARPLVEGAAHEAWLGRPLLSLGLGFALAAIAFPVAAMVFVIGPARRRVVDRVRLARAWYGLLALVRRGRGRSRARAVDRSRALASHRSSDAGRRTRRARAERDRCGSVPRLAGLRRRRARRHRCACVLALYSSRRRGHRTPARCPPRSRCSPGAAHCMADVPPRTARSSEISGEARDHQGGRLTTRDRPRRDKRVRRATHEVPLDGRSVHRPGPHAVPRARGGDADRRHRQRRRCDRAAVADAAAHQRPRRGGHWWSRPARSPRSSPRSRAASSSTGSGRQRTSVGSDVFSAVSAAMIPLFGAARHADLSARADRIGHRRDVRSRLASPRARRCFPTWRSGPGSSSSA